MMKTEFTLESCKWCSYNIKFQDNPRRCFKHYASEGELSLCVDWAVFDEDRLEYARTLTKNYNKMFMADPWSTMEKLSKILLTGYTSSEDETNE